MVAPCYFLACRIFEDAGLRTRAVGEGDEGVDLVGLEKGLIEEERNIVGKVSLRFHGFRFREDCSTMVVTWFISLSPYGELFISVDERSR